MWAFQDVAAGEEVFIYMVFDLHPIPRALARLVAAVQALLDNTLQPLLGGKAEHGARIAHQGAGTGQGAALCHRASEYLPPLAQGPAGHVVAVQGKDVKRTKVAGACGAAVAPARGRR